MSTQSLFDEGIELYEQKEYKKAIEKFLEVLENIPDKSTKIKVQIYAQHGLGRCYLAQAIKSNLTDTSPLFKQAIEHYTKELELAETLTGENATQEQINAQGWLGRCYLEHTIKSNLTDAKPLFEKAIEHYTKRLTLAETLTGENATQEQINAQGWLGRCYLEHAIKSNLTDAKPLFEKAIEYYTKRLKLAKTLTGENTTQAQINTQGWLGQCYLQYAIPLKAT